MQTVLFFFRLLRTSIRASITVRGAFALEFVLGIANNLIFFSMWWIFFRQFNDIGGWTLSDMAASMAILTGSYGLTQVCFGGVRSLGSAILNGDLDPFMTQPKNLLLHLLGAKSRSRGFGHLMTSVILLALGNFPLQSCPLIFLLIASGCLIFVSLGVLVHSLTFWLGALDAVSQKYLDSFFVFALYPTNIYSGLLQLVMFTVIPAAFIGYLPVELLRSFSWPKLLAILGGALSFSSLAATVFYLGLKRYESGNRFGMRL